MQIVIGDRKENRIDHDEHDVVFDMQKVDQLRDKQRDAEDHCEYRFPFRQQQAEKPGKDLENIAAVGQHQYHQGFFWLYPDLGRRGRAHHKIGGDQRTRAEEDLDDAGNAQMLGSTSHKYPSFLHKNRSKQWPACSFLAES